MRRVTDWRQYWSRACRRLAILLVEQNALAALRMADYGYVLEMGRVVLHGPCEALASDKGAYLGRTRETGHP